MTLRGSFVCLDERDEVLCNTMIYMDKRGAEECAEYLALRSEMDIFARCGHYVDPMFGIYKIRWMQKHCPKLMAKMRRICFIADFITYKLGAAHKCDYSLAARSAMFDVFHKAWIDEALAFAGLDRAMLPEAVPGGSAVGEVSPAIAQELGLGAGVKLIVAGHDQVAAVMGSGAWEAGETANGMGTTDCITAVLSAEGLDYESLIRNSLTLVPYLDSGRFVTYAFNVSGGCAVKWFRDTLAKDIAEREDAYALLNQEAPSEPTDLIVLPYLAGSGTPYMDGNTPCVFAGLRLGTDRGKLFRGLLEGETYEMMVNIECLKECGVEVEKVITVGAAAVPPVDADPRRHLRPGHLPPRKQRSGHPGHGHPVLCGDGPLRLDPRSPEEDDFLLEEVHAGRREPRPLCGEVPEIQEAVRHGQRAVCLKRGGPNVRIHPRNHLERIPAGSGLARDPRRVPGGHPQSDRKRPRRPGGYPGTVCHPGRCGARPDPVGAG